MDTLGFFGYVCALFIGVILGLIGGGGSILTVPILVYLFFLNPVTATAYSLFVVGSTTFFGSIRNIKKRMIDYKAGIIFAIPSFIAVYITRKYLVPAIPEKLFLIGDFLLTKDIAIMIFFSFLMLVAAFFMIKDKKMDVDKNAIIKYNYLSLIIQGFIIGFLTAIIGAGGGFLIVPALVLWLKLPMKKAVGTALFIISIKSLIGFIGDIENLNIDWVFLLSFTAISVIGIYLGIYLSNFIEGRKLKKSFGWFVLVMSIYILVIEVF
ncbi:MAG: sulfite exporter TauE/SafE family protein [Flavobacteriaceae bacterium]|nr:sulfite exporter TauE/SafE family protein [Flavobacteriaceae bacterium]